MVSPVPVSATTAQLAPTFVTKNIQQVAVKYNRDCRTYFDELSKVVQVSTGLLILFLKVKALNFRRSLRIEWN